MDLPIDEMSKKGIAPPYVPEMQKKKRKERSVSCGIKIFLQKKISFVVQIGKILSFDYFF